jgi:hypothetical protein
MMERKDDFMRIEGKFCLGLCAEIIKRCEVGKVGGEELLNFE